MLVDEFNKKYTKELCFELPIESHGLMIYPIKVSDMFLFSECAKILYIRKDEIPDVRIIKMTYLEYLISIFNEEQLAPNDMRIFQSMLYVVMCLCLRKDNIKMFFGKDVDGAYLKIDEVRINGNDFNDILNIIKFQNDPLYTGEEINPELRKEIEEAERLSVGGKKPINIEQRMIVLEINSGISRSEIIDMSYRRFILSQKISENIIDYKMKHEAELNGTKFKKPLLHYLCDNPNELNEKIMSYDKIEGKFTEPTS